MHKHEGIVVVAFKPGQPASQVQADLALAGFDWGIRVHNYNQLEYGWAIKVNLYHEAESLVQELEEAGFQAHICQGVHGWEVE